VTKREKETKREYNTLSDSWVKRFIITHLITTWHDDKMRLTAKLFTLVWRALQCVADALRQRLEWVVESCQMTEQSQAEGKCRKMFINHVTCTTSVSCFLTGTERSPPVALFPSSGSYSYITYPVDCAVNTLIPSCSGSSDTPHLTSTCGPHGDGTADPDCVMTTSYPLSCTGKNLKQDVFTFCWCSCQQGWLTMSNKVTAGWSVGIHRFSWTG